MTKLSVNINKIALIRNARGANHPDLLQVALDCEEFGAEGITVHPRPDERHIRYDDLSVLKSSIATEFNIEGYPSNDFIDRVIAVRPAQCTLVPDLPGALTSDTGWDAIKHGDFLTVVVARLKAAGIRTSLFIDPLESQLHAAKDTGTDRIEFYTGPYAAQYNSDRARAIAPYATAALICNEIDLGINAGHDLNLDNLAYFRSKVPQLLEVSIGHALICDAVYLGLKNTIQLYLHRLV